MAGAPARRVSVGGLARLVSGATLLGTLLSAPLLYAALLILMLPLAEASLALFAELHAALLFEVRPLRMPVDPIYNAAMIRDAGRFFSGERAGQLLLLGFVPLLFVATLPAIFKPRSWTGLLLALAWSLLPLLLCLGLLAPGGLGGAALKALPRLLEPFSVLGPALAGSPQLLLLAFLPAALFACLALAANLVVALREPVYRRALRGATFLARLRRVTVRRAALALLRAGGRVALAAGAILLVDVVFLALLSTLWLDGSLRLALWLAAGAEGQMTWLWVMIALAVLIALVALGLMAGAGRLLLGRWLVGWDALCLVAGLPLLAMIEGAGIVTSAGFLFGFPGLFLLLAGRALLFRAMADAGARARLEMQAGVSELSGRYRRRPALYLRPFAEDWRVVRDLRDRVVGLLLARPVPRRLEEVIADSVFRRRPLVALGNPAESRLAGAAKAAVEDAAWQRTVANLLDAADFVILVVGPTVNIHWEVERIRQAERLAHCVFVVPSEAALSGFLAANPAVGAAFGLEAAAPPAQAPLLFYRDTAGRPVLVNARSRSITAYELALDIASSDVGTARP